MENLAFISGATSGFGKATALLFAKMGWNLIITGRRENLLAEFAIQLKKDFGIQVFPLSFDIRDSKAVQKALTGLPDQWRNIDVLINNAGLAAGFNPIHEGNLEDWEAMIDTNVKGILYVTRIISPWMIERGKGHILNIGSTAGKEVYPNGNVYCASKFAVDALTKAMRIDLLAYGIKVTQISPGLAETEFSIVRFKGDESRAKKVYEGMQPLRAEDIAEVIWFAITRPPHVCLNDIVMTPTAQATSTLVNRKS